MERGIHFAQTIPKFTDKSYAPQWASKSKPVFVVSAFVLGRDLTMVIV